MPNYDLSSADFGLVANTEVDLLRVANQTVWAKPSDSSEVWSVFDDAEVTLQSFSDATNTDGIMNQYFKHSGTALEIVEIGIYLPADSFLAGLSGYVQAQFNSGGFLKDSSYSSAAAVASRIATGTLVQGWNWVSLPTPLAWTDTNPYALVGYVIGSNYLYNGAATSNAISSDSVVSTGGNFELVPNAVSTGDLERGWFDQGFGIHSFVSTAARSYGMDVRAREA